MKKSNLTQNPYMYTKMIKFKAFIYRLSAVFGLKIYLAKKEEQAYVDSFGPMDKFSDGLTWGSWQAAHGFVSVWTYKMSLKEKLRVSIRNVFRR